MVEAVARSERLPRLAKYEVLEEIGHGGMAAVYRARDRRLGREVAVKVIHPHLRDSTEVVNRFNAEARAVAKLKHPNIVEVFDVSEEDEEEKYLVVELVRGTTLRKVLQAHGALPPEIAAAVALELLGALAHAHASGVVHRDIKPENVLIEQQPEEIAADAGRDAPEDSPERRPPAEGRVRVKLTDFGIAKLLDAQGVTSTGQVLGSPAHMAPEQIEGGEVDARADLFGLGVLLYECMVGHLPFEGTNPAQVLRRVLEGTYPAANDERAVVGSRWSRILDRALAHAAADRFPDAHAMQGAIGDELARLAVTSPRAEIEAWLADPPGYAGAYRPHMIEKLRVLGGQARDRGDVLSAASDYNRALAYAPDDARLLRIVARMHRAQALAIALRRVAVVLAVLVAGASAAWAFGRFVRREGTPPPGASAVQGPATARQEFTTTPAGLSASPPPSAASHGTATASASAVPSAAVGGRTAERTVTLDLKPPMGVTVSVDGQSTREVATGDRLTVDVRPHTLTFSCSVCNPVRIALGGGDKDDTLLVSVPIKPATLVVEGDLAKTYQILQRPEIWVRAGVNTVPLRSAFERVDVKQIETGSAVSVRLEAGKTIRATFD